MENRPDQENIDTLLAHGKRVSFGKSCIEITWYEGWIAGWIATKVEEGHKAPLKQDKIEDKKKL